MESSRWTAVSMSPSSMRPFASASRMRPVMTVESVPWSVKLSTPAFSEAAVASSWVSK